jgi:hypothetical protein
VLIVFSPVSAALPVRSLADDPRGLAIALTGHGHGWNGSMGAASKPLPPFRHDRWASLEKRWRPILSGATAQLWEADCLTVSRLAGFGRDRTWGLGFPRLRYREGERAVFNQR